MYIFGTDEAGYGPNLGPLVVSACGWEVPDSLFVDRMYEALFPVVLPWSGRKNLTADANDPGRFLLDDSKKLYQGQLSSGGLKHLEYALLTCLASLGRIDLSNATIADVFHALVKPGYLSASTTGNAGNAEDAGNAGNAKNAEYSGNADKAGVAQKQDDEESLPGLDFGDSPSESCSCVNETGALELADAASRFSEPLGEKPSEGISVPVDADAVRLTACVERFRTFQSESGVYLRELVSDAVFPQRFNQLCRRLGNKSTVLSRVTLALLYDAMIRCPCEKGIILCDKHGSRDRYADLLRQQFQTDVEILIESRSISTYQFVWRSGSYRISFQAKGDSQPPAALASVADKYLRELAMRQFNEFWQEQIPGLEPTAGYPVDAKRFLAQIDEKRRQLEIPLDILWRER